MAYLHNVFGFLDTRGVQGIHYEPHSNVGLNDAIEMPTPAELRSLAVLPNTMLADGDDNILRGEFEFALPARLHPGIVYNSKDGMVVGKAENGDEVWAHIHCAHGNLVLCDRPQRAFLLFQAAGSGGVVRCLTSLEEIREWDADIAGECEGLVLRWAFVYDALVQELKAEKS